MLSCSGYTKQTTNLGYHQELLNSIMALYHYSVLNRKSVNDNKLTLVPHTAIFFLI